MDQQRLPSPTSSDVVVMAGQQLQDASAVAKPKTAKRPRKKSKRPTKRFLWQEDLHLSFVAAIFDLGLKNASPKALLPFMKKSDPDSGLTAEHLKSHLQKYRINYERSRREFQELCDRELKRSRKRRRRHQQRQSGVSDAYVFPLRSAKSGRDATDSDSELEGDENNVINGLDACMEEKSPQLRPFVSTHELADAASRYPASYLPVQQALVPVPAAIPELTDAQWRTFSMLMSTPALEFTSKSGTGDLSIQIPQEASSSLSAQPQVQDELQTQMHQAMQAQMNFHRQMLTRKGEVSHDLLQGTRMESLSAYSGCGDYSFNGQLPVSSGFDQAWTQQIHQQRLASHRLQQEQEQEQQQPMGQYRDSQGPLPPALHGASGAASQSLPRWSKQSRTDSAPKIQIDPKSDAVGDDLSRWDPFNVGLEDENLFDFLKA